MYALAAYGLLNIAKMVKDNVTDWLPDDAARPALPVMADSRSVVFDRGYVKRVLVYHFGSEDRDKRIHPQSQEYYVRFPHGPLHNVIDVSVLHAVVPRSEYVITEWNNQLVIEEAIPNNTFTMEIPVGDYTSHSLCKAIYNMLNHHTPAMHNKYKLLFSGSTKRMAIVADSAPTELPTLFRVHTHVKNTATCTLGLNEVNTEYNLKQVAGTRMNLVGSNFVDLRIPELGTEANLARISLERPINEYTGHSINDKWRHPIGKLAGLTLQFVSFDSRVHSAVPYNFRGLENSVTLQITTLVRAPMEMRITN